MKERVLHGTGRDCRLLVGGRLEDLESLSGGARRIVFADETVLRLHGKRIPAGPVVVVGAGEEAKTLANAGRLYEELLRLEADRDTFLVGIGGGVVCDVTGFVAATYLRGLRVGFAPTTLLAQVDAAIGGKNGVNLHGYKNLVGTIRQPEFVLCDLELLATLPPGERRNGLAEVVKHALIADAGLFDYLEENAAAAAALDPRVTPRLVGDSITVKAAIVARDEFETGDRRLLNFGHTFGHALEKAAGVPHGEAVSAGMAVATGISVARGMLAADEAERVLRLLDALGLPRRIGADPERLFEGLRKDKKRSGGRIRFIFLERIGKAAAVETALEELQELFLSWEGSPHGRRVGEKP
ncbi:MAG: 3-dehydroquinate synthase [Desulfobacterales bacterium]